MKPVVHFKKDSLVFLPSFGGKEVALLFPLDHPDNLRVTNKKEATTSEVVQKTYEGQTLTSFETKNTIYIPV